MKVVSFLLKSTFRQQQRIGTHQTDPQERIFYGGLLIVGPIDKVKLKVESLIKYFFSVEMTKNVARNPARGKNQ